LAIYSFSVLAVGFATFLDSFSISHKSKTNELLLISSSPNTIFVLFCQEVRKSIKAFCEETLPSCLFSHSTINNIPFGLFAERAQKTFSNRMETSFQELENWLQRFAICYTKDFCVIYLEVETETGE